MQPVADSDLTRSLGSLSVGLNPAEFACPCSERARLEESGGPEPFVHSHPGHNPIFISRACQTPAGLRYRGVIQSSRLVDSSLIDKLRVAMRSGTTPAIILYDGPESHRRHARRNAPCDPEA